MPQEIERKFLVKSDDWRRDAINKRLLDQGYLSVDPDRTVRIRVAEDRAFITIKGRKVGAAAPEFEYAIPVEDAEAILSQLSVIARIKKYRHEVEHGGLRWEIDEFLDDNSGLVIAELELATEDEVFALPEWAGEEVTADSRYFNSSLGVNPFNKWSAKSFQIPR